MKEFLTPEDVARELRVSRQTVKRLIWENDLPVITTSRRGGFKYLIPVQSFYEWKVTYRKKKLYKKHLSDIDFLKEQQIEWLNWCRNGALIGRPMTVGTVEKNNHSLNAYWKRLPRRYNTDSLISAKLLRYVLSSIDEKMFGLKDNIYKAIRSFTKYLSINNYCEKSLINTFDELKPKRVYPPKKLHCSQEQFELLLKEAGIRTSGQSSYDMILNKTIVATLGYTGLRISELCNLRMQDVDLINRKIFVYLGKGKKNRYVGISNNLYSYLVEYLEKRPKSDQEYFFLTISNVNNEPVPFDRNTLGRKIKRLSQRANIKISPHGLRRTFATIAANSGKPINIISLALGHSDLKTTQGYLCTSQDEVIKEMQGW